MAERTEIAWTDSTHNAWEGCQKVGPGCDNCYAEARNARFGGGHAVNWGPGAPRRLTSEHNRNNLERWNRRQFAECDACGWRGDHAPTDCKNCGAKGSTKEARRRVFCSSLSDLFDNEVEQAWRDAMFTKAEACTNLDFLFLTKRIGNVRRMVPKAWLKPGGWPAHVRLLITVVNQEEADRDIPKLLALGCPNGLSMEPLLSAVDLAKVWVPNGILRNMVPALQTLNWVIVGGESGPGARPMNPAWARDLRDQCADFGVPFHFKQWGEWLNDVDASMLGNESTPLHQFDDRSCAVKVGKKAAGRLLDGVEHNGFPS